MANCDLCNMGHTVFEHWLGSVVEAARLYSCPQVQIPDKSLVHCDCLLPILALTSITDLTQWFRLQLPGSNPGQVICGSLFSLSLHAPGSNPGQVTYSQLFFTHLSHLYHRLSSFTISYTWLHGLRLQDICTPRFKSWTSHQSIMSLLQFIPLTSLTDLTQWLRL